MATRLGSNFDKLSIAVGVSNVGDGMLAFPLLVATLTRDPAPRTAAGPRAFERCVGRGPMPRPEWSGRDVGPGDREPQVEESGPDPQCETRDDADQEKDASVEVLGEEHCRGSTSGSRCVEVS
jgi:hypothetical protein